MPASPPRTWWNASSPPRAVPGRPSGARPSSSGSGSGARNTAEKFSIRSSVSAPRSIGAENASPWTRACPGRCAKCSCASTKRGSSTGVTTSSTGARAVTPPWPIWRWNTPPISASSTTSAIRWKARRTPSSPWPPPGPKPCSVTRPWPCIPRTSATSTSWANTSCCRWSAAAFPSSPMPTSNWNSAPAVSRSRRPTT